MPFMENQFGDDRFDKHDGKTSASKNDQNNDNLRSRFDMPSILQFFNPFWCGHKRKVKNEL